MNDMKHLKWEYELPLPFQQKLVTDVFHAFKHLPHIAYTERWHKNAV